MIESLDLIQTILSALAILILIYVVYSKKAVGLLFKQTAILISIALIIFTGTELIEFFEASLGEGFHETVEMIEDPLNIVFLGILLIAIGRETSLISKTREFAPPKK